MYDIELSPSALKFLEKLSKSQRKIADRVISAVDMLRTAPYSGKKLMGPLSGLRALRSGDYRIIYSVFEHKVLIQIVNIGHRREIYR